MGSKFGEWLLPEPKLGQHVKGDFFEIDGDVHFQDKDGSKHFVPSGFVTDGYSKPWLFEWLVGSNFSDDLRPAVLHDRDCQRAILNKEKGLDYESFSTVNDRFYRGMRATGNIGLWKCLAMRFAVNFNPDRW